MKLSKFLEIDFEVFFLVLLKFFLDGLEVCFLSRELYFRWYI